MTRSWIFYLLIGACVGGTIFASEVPDLATANLVLGQKSFTTKTFTTASASTLFQPTGIAIDPVSRKVFISDTQNCRILRYPNATSLGNGAAAEAVFGQSRFTDREPHATASGLSSPNGIFFDSKGRLWVADTGNDRVLVYHDAVHRTSGTNADHVYGEPDFTTPSSSERSAFTMQEPMGVSVDSEDRLWVVDQGNDRILRFDAISTKSDGAPANGVLGPPDFTTYVASETEKILDRPVGLTVSSAGSLFVADGRNRVVRYDHAANLMGNVYPNAVIGQPDLWSNLYGTSKTRIFYPGGVALTKDDTLWVTDSYNCRLVRFDDASSKSDGAPADGIIGQPDYFSGSEKTTSKGLAWPYGNPCVDVDGNLWISDYNNNRVLRYSEDHTPPKLTLVTVIPTAPVYKYFKIQVIATDENSVAGVFYKLGENHYRPAIATRHRWETGTDIPLKKGLNVFRFYAVDTAGNRSPVKVVRIKSSGGYAPPKH